MPLHPLIKSNILNRLTPAPIIRIIYYNSLGYGITVYFTNQVFVEKTRMIMSFLNNFTRKTANLFTFATVDNYVSEVKHSQACDTTIAQKSIPTCHRIFKK